MAKEIDEKQAKQEIEQKLDQATKDLNKKVAVALIGQVSAGKSSLLMRCLSVVGIIHWLKWERSQVLRQRLNHSQSVKT